ncbi:MAG: alpha/beta hydrolase [Deltaproteobacteria bacterium]|nr:alpha/beta hydrolase [Deltaproteobacteria bacterium]
MSSKGASPERWVLVLHGILGSRSNWRGLARKVVAECPEWGACLVDLRMHGDSRGFAPPHTVAAAAADLEALSGVVPGPIAGVLGHSFGGKVALAYARSHGRDNLESLVSVDSNPGARPGAPGAEGSVGVVSMLGELPRAWLSRDDFVEAVVARGHDESLARWLAMNLEAMGDGYQLRLDLDAVAGLLDDYFRTDLWSVLETAPPAPRIDLIVGGASSVYDAADLRRAEAIAEASATVNLEVIQGAGHWVHVDAPEALLAVWAKSLGGGSI